MFDEDHLPAVFDLHNQSVGVPLKLHHREAWDSLKVAEIACGHAIAEFQRRHADQPP